MHLHWLGSLLVSLSLSTLTSALPQESATPTVAAPTTKSPVATPPPSGLFQIGSNCDGSFRCFSVLPSDCEAAITAVIAKARSQAPAPDTVNSNLYASSGKCAASFTCDDCDSAGCKFPLQRVFIGELENVFRSVYKGNGQGPGCKTCGNIKFQNLCRATLNHVDGLTNGFFSPDATAPLNIPTV